MDAWKEICRELAEDLGEERGLRLLRLLQLTGLLDLEEAEGPSPGEAAPASDGPRPISIWRPEERDGRQAFVRPPPGALGDHHAGDRVLWCDKEPGVRRVVLLGESVAAGYLYAPHYSPAVALRGALAGAVEDFEVVDLARTNETLGGLLATAEAARQLQPDAWVVFAGNNWTLLETPRISPYAPSVSWRQKIAYELRRGGLPAVAELARRRQKRRVTRTIDRLAEIAGEDEARLLWLIPEVNLRHWQTRQPALCADAESTATWHRLDGEAQVALEEGDGVAAAEIARRMLELDGGQCATSHRLLAEALLLTGDEAGGLAACRAEVDAVSSSTLGFLSAPQIGSAGREWIQSAAQRHGFETLDLGEILTAEAGEAALGRESFLDYCHLSSRGIRRAMEAVAHRLVGGEAASAEPLQAPAPTAEAEALAWLGAALHTAHRMLAVTDRRPLLAHACRRALEVWPPIADTLLDYVEAHCSPLPAVATRAQQRALATPYRLLLQHGWRYEHLDGELLGVFRDCLEKAGAAVGGKKAVAGFDELLQRHLAVPGEGVDLMAEGRWLWEPLERFYPEVMSSRDLPERATLRSPTPHTSWGFVSAPGQSLEVEICLRLPGGGSEEAAAGDEVALVLDGEEVERWNVERRWVRRRATLSENRLAPGLHRLDLHWPLHTPDADGLRQRARGRLELGVEADLYPIFGEVFSLRLRPASPDGAATATPVE